MQLRPSRGSTLGTTFHLAQINTLSRPCHASANFPVLILTCGLLLEVTVTAANVHDSVAAPDLLEKFMAAPGRLLKLVWADSAYQGEALAEAFARHGVKVEVVRRSDGQKGFVVLARRWVVERTLGWLSRARRLNRDHERRPDHHEQMVWWAGLLTLTRRMARQRLHWPERRAGDAARGTRGW
jgi:transposase